MSINLLRITPFCHQTQHVFRQVQKVFLRNRLSWDISESGEEKKKPLVFAEVQPDFELYCHGSYSQAPVQFHQCRYAYFPFFNKGGSHFETSVFCSKEFDEAFSPSGCCPQGSPRLTRSSASCFITASINHNFTCHFFVSFFLAPPPDTKKGAQFNAWYN